MLTYLFDASAAVHIYLEEDKRIRKIVQHIVEQRRTYKQALVLIPNFCVAEVFNTFARKHFKDRRLDREKYADCVRQFGQDIHWGKTLYVYDLSRYHIVGVDEIIPIEHRVASETERDHLSTFDILLIAMACELAYAGRPEETFLVTCDKRIKKVLEELKCSKEEVSADGRVIGVLDDRPAHRWLPPNVLYLPGIKAWDLPKVNRQPPLNL